MAEDLNEITIDCYECDGTGDHFVEEVFGMKTYVGDCESCRGSGKVTEVWDGKTWRRKEDDA